MFDEQSRYAKLPILGKTADDGTVVAYVSRRFLPEGSKLPLLGETTAQSADRPDLIAQRTLGDPLSFWRVADANNVMDPDELCDEPGEILSIPVPQP